MKAIKTTIIIGMIIIGLMMSATTTGQANFKKMGKGQGQSEFLKKCNGEAEHNLIGNHHNAENHHSCKVGSCNKCEGSGYCHVCSGAGKLNGQECSICSGTGRCFYCGGDGELWD